MKKIILITLILLIYKKSKKFKIWHLGAQSHNTE